MRKLTISLVLVAIASVVLAANEITVSALLKVNKDAVSLQRSSGTVQITLDGSRYNVQTITATTTNQTLTAGSITSSGWYYMRNLSTNPTEKVFITFDAGVTTSHVLEAKEPMFGRLATDVVVTNFTVATTNGTCDFEFTVIED